MMVKMRYCILFLSVFIFVESYIYGSNIHIDEKHRSAVAKGLDYLKTQQNRDGSWDSGMYHTDPGITALALLAFMAGGNLPEEGMYADTVRRGLFFILKNVSSSGLIATSSSHNTMYSHGYATLFLAEIYGMTGKREIKPFLHKAVSLILGAQKKDGGWRYTPDPQGNSDISLTVVQLMALRAARNAGIAIDARPIKRALTYIMNSVCADGGFSYTLQQKQSGFARTAAGLTSLYVGGEYQGPLIDNALKYLMTYKDRDEGMSWFYYGHYYAAQAMFQAGGDYWKQWYPRIRDLLLKKQSPQGSWERNSSAGPVFATAISVMILEIPYQYLPIFQR